VILIGNNFDIKYASPSFEKVFGKSNKEFLNTPITDFFTNYVHPDNLDSVMESFEKCAAKPGQECRAEFQFKHADGTWHYFVAVGQNHLDTPAVNGLVVNLRDITEQKRASADLRRIEWMLTSGHAAEDEDAAPYYGDLTALNTERTILDAVGSRTLEDIVHDYLDLLDTSAAIYERNGGYALGIFASGWCRYLDGASRRLCDTDDNAEALVCGKWHCHESCWTEASKTAIEKGEVIDIECAGGLRLYAVPIRAGGRIIGAINFGYGNPPRDPQILKELAAKYNVPVGELAKYADAYETRPPYIIENAKRRIETSARLIGEMVERKRASEALRKNEELLRTIVENVNDIIWQMDAKANFTYVSPSVERILRYLPDEIVGTNALSHFREEDRPKIMERIRQRAQGTIPSGAQTEYEMKAKDGSFVPVEVSSSAQKDSDGNLIGFSGVARDIRERKKLEEKARIYLNISKVMLIGFDKNHTVTIANEQASQILGLPVNTIVGKNWFDNFIPERLRADVKSVAEKILAGDINPVKVFENPVLCNDGSERLILWNNSYTYGDDGKINGFLSSGLDITEQRETEIVLKKTEEKFHNLFNNMGAAGCFDQVIYKNGKAVDYIILDINPAFEKLLGCKKEDVAGKPASEFYSGYEIPFFDTYIKVAETGESVSFEGFFPPVNRYFHVVASCPSKGFFSTIITDITERKRMEDTLQRHFALLRMAGEKAKFGGWGVDLATNTCIWSDEVAAIHEMPAGYSPPVQDGINFYAPEWREKITKVFTDCAERGIPYDEEMQIITAKGNRVWVRTIGEAVRDSDGNIIGVQGSFQDITNHKFQEAEIENLNSFLISIRDLNQEIVKEQDFDILLASSCRILTEIRGYMDVSIAFMDESDHTIKPRAHHGTHGRNQWQFSDEGEVPECVRRMMNEGHAFIMSNGDLNCRDCGFCSHDTDHQSILVPMLGRSGNLMGIITACLEPGRAIHPNEVPLFEEVAGDLVFAYEKICSENALEGSEAMFRNLFDTMSQGVVYQDAEGKITSANAAAENILGLSLDQMQGRTSMDPRWKAIHEDGSEYPGEEHPAMVALRIGKPVRDIMGIFNPESGEHRWVNVHAVPEFRMGEEKPFRVYTTLEDITQQKNFMVELERRNDFIYSVLNNLTIGVAVNKIDTGEAIFINPQFARTYGWPAENFVDIPTFFEQVYPDPEYRIPLQERVMADIASMDPERMHWEDLMATAKDGTKRYISARNIPLPEENLMISTVWDVTERKKAEMEMGASETRYRRLFESAKDGILILDAKSGNIVDVNPFLVELLGIPSENFLGKKLWEIGFFKDIAANEANFIELQNKGYVRYEDMPLETKDGRRIDVEFVSNVYDVNDSKVIQCNVRDITVRKQAEDELRVLTMKLQTIADEKTRELEAIHATMLKQERLSLLGQMAASVSHELRNPLSVINNVAYYLRAQHPELDEKSAKMLDILEREVERSDRIIGNMLGFSRSKPNLTESLDINDMVKQYFADQDRLPGNIQLNLELADNLPTLNADMEKLNQVLDNLVSNACHAMPDGGTLTIASKVGDNNTLELTVRDTGHGMSADVQKKIFEPLFSTKTTGFGLGLVVVKTMVEDHHGQVKVSSEEGKGTEFIISLPLDGGNAGNETGTAGDR
jgi:PAS domain S-box-containing protein